MKKKNLKNLQLNKNVVSNFKNRSLSGGAAITADVKDCPDNTLADGCKTLGACPYEPISQTELFVDCCTII
ncbi:hypothetical protein H2O64_09945 [Kordia sp. YSTF-M3]|uniref:Bacteriocin n=1 Tax=Kordia aestuariivivens TaxID=2759037 RepID=A0ABR7Q925_9FLAO|nr:hypothetical protein [Kordia aestuariivivens]MBC8754993.1 hypothetical protein [Kordia aestuariivivens]